MMPPPTGRMPGSASSTTRGSRDYTPLVWSSYYEEMLDLKIDQDSFRVYLSGFEAKKENAADDKKPLLVLLHGGGYSSLTWSLFTKSIRSLCECRVAAIDLRGHGNTCTQNDEDLSSGTMANDVANVIHKLVNDNKMYSSPIICVGHSMGGAIAVHFVASLHETDLNVVGLVVIDVVEGTAMDALHCMQSVLRSRPKHFPSLENGIEWCVRSGQTRNLEAARVSMPGQLKNSVTNLPAISELDLKQTNDPTDALESEPKTSLNTNTSSKLLSLEKIEEESTQTLSEPQATFKSPRAKSGFTWRTDLSKSEPFWSGWFYDLSNIFLSCPANAKLLLLAGIDRLDRTLTIGQMQGKFQMQVLPKCGHTVHEDVPDKVAEAIASFLIRNKFTQSKTDFERPFPSC